jgi:phosphoenolpyruvate synthase/pyruvate phosphate dikinase
MSDQELAVPLRDARDPAVVGGKGASLGELTRAGVAVPPGFVVTVGAFAAVMAANARARHRRAAAGRRLRGHRDRVRQARHR